MLAVAAFALAEPMRALPEASPEATVAGLHAGLVEQSQAAPDAAFEERYARLAPLITATHDLPYIARFALGRHWATLAADEQSRYLDAFERLSIASYAARFARLTPESFRRAGVEPAAGGRQVVAASIVPANAEPVPLEYVLHEAPDGWRIVNIVGAGVSDLALKRAEYQSLMSTGGFDGLIAALEEQSARLARGEVEPALPR